MTSGSLDDNRPRMARARSRGRSRCLRLAAAAGLLLVLTRLAAPYPVLDPLSHFVPQLAVLVIAGSIGAILPQRQVWAAVMISALGLLLIGLSPWALAPASADVTAPPATRLVKVMSFNTAVWNPDGSAIVPEVLREKPDIIVFVELGPRAVTSLPQLAADYPYGFLCSDRVTCNVAILSKLPIQSSSMRGPPGAPPLMRASFGPEIGGLTVVGVHLTRFPRAAMQFRQAEQLALMLKRIGGSQLVMGDFNATPFSQVLVRFAGATGLNRLTWLPSWPASFRLPQLAIDHIFVSDGITAVAGPRLGGYAGSDHYPIIATLAVPVGSAP